MGHGEIQFNKNKPVLRTIMSRKWKHVTPFFLTANISYETRTYNIFHGENEKRNVFDGRFSPQCSLLPSSSFHFFLSRVLFPEARSKTNGEQTGYNGAAVRRTARSKAGEALRYLYWLLEAWQWSTGNSILCPPLSFCLRGFSSVHRRLPRSTGERCTRQRRTNKSFVDPRWRDSRKRVGRTRTRANVQRDENKRGTARGKWWVERDGSEDRLLSGTGRAYKLIEKELALWATESWL